MRSLSIVLCVTLAAGCSAPTSGNAAMASERNEADVPEANGVEVSEAPANAVIAAPAPEALGPNGEHWMYGTTDSKDPYAMYGPEDAESLATLECGARGLMVSLPNVDPSPARARAIVTSGAVRFEAPTKIEGEEISTLSFVVPYADPLVSAMPVTGFTVSFRNGEKNPFPGGQPVARLITECRKRQAAGVVPTISFAGSYSTEISSIEVEQTGQNSYTLKLTYMYEMATGNFRTDDIERQGTAKGNVLTLTPYSASDKPCRLSQVGTSDKYRMVGCDKPIDGLYTRK